MKKKNKNKKNIITTSEQELEVNTAIWKLKSLKKADFTSIGINIRTEGVYIKDISSPLVDQDKIKNNYTDINIIKENIDYKLEAMESRLSEKNTQSLSQHKEDFRKEITEIKNSFLIWLIGIIIVIILGLIVSHFTSLNILSQQIFEKLNSSFGIRINKIEKNIDDLFIEKNNKDIKKGKGK